MWVHEEVLAALPQASTGFCPGDIELQNKFDPKELFHSILPLDIYYTVVYLLWHRFERYDLVWN